MAEINPSRNIYFFLHIKLKAQSYSNNNSVISEHLGAHI